MRIERATIQLNQQDFEDAAKEWLPAGFALEHVRIFRGGVMASLKTPYVRLDLRLKKEPDLAQGILVFSYVVSKGVPIPKRLVQLALQKVAADLPKGITMLDQQLVIAVSELSIPYVRAGELDCDLQDGYVSIVAEGVRVSTSLAPATMGKQDGIA